MNLVISTTKGWNIGDQFIFAGVKSLLKEAWGDFQHVVHNRNPEILPKGGEPSHVAIRSGWADAFVVAGSPGWTGECSAIYRTAMKFGVPIYIIGIGAGVPQSHLMQEVLDSDQIKAALNWAKLVICRDEVVREVVLQHRSEAHLLPCPAIFTPHSTIAPAPSGELIALGPDYRGSWDRDGMMAHQAADLEASFGKAFYSSDPKDYLARYKGAASVISSRLHASVVCKAMGTPVQNLWQPDDFRCATAWAVIESACASGLELAREQYISLLRQHKPSERLKIAATSQDPTPDELLTTSPITNDCSAHLPGE